LNEAMPQPRTFSSSVPAEPPNGAAPPDPAGSPGTQQGWQVPVLVGLGGLAAGAALAVLGVVALGLVPPADPLADPLAGFGEPLDATAALAADAMNPVPPSRAIVIDVAGAVAQPGLHRLRDGDRVGDAIEAAGGFAPRADLAAASQTLNLAQPLEDGTKVLVPELGIDLGIDRPVFAATDDGRIDINRADQAELETLPGVGPVTARKILDARAEQRFAGVRDLRSRGLVGESVYGDLKGLVRAD